MNGDLRPQDVKKGDDIWFFEKPKDAIPTLRTMVHDVVSDFRDRWYIEAYGLPEPYPIYHFRKPGQEPEKYSSTVPLVECDDLYKRSGF